MSQLKIEFKKKVTQIAYNPHATIRQVIANAGVALSKDPHSIRLLYQAPDQQKPLPLTKEANTLQDYSIPEGATLHVKDLGPQIGYRTVFLAEYLGPLSIWWLLILFPSLFYTFYNPGYQGHTLTNSQMLATILWTAHYGKRLFESVFVHSFSHATMPLFNLFKNCIYYWGFAFLIAYRILHPNYTPAPFIFQIVGVIVFCACETCNYICHSHLASLRTTANSTEHPVPTHPFFQLVVCPNYMFEILSWFGFNLATSTFMGVCFMICGAVQMYFWADKKKRRYRSEHPEYPKSMKLLFPMLL